MSRATSRISMSNNSHPCRRLAPLRRSRVWPASPQARIPNPNPEIRTNSGSRSVLAGEDSELAFAMRKLTSPSPRGRCISNLQQPQSCLNMLRPTGRRSKAIITSTYRFSVSPVLRFQLGSKLPACLFEPRICTFPDPHAFSIPIRLSGTPFF